MKKLYIACANTINCCAVASSNCYAQTNAAYLTTKYGIQTEVITSGHYLLERHDITTFPSFIFTKSNVVACIVQGKFMDSTVTDKLKELTWI